MVKACARITSPFFILQQSTLTTPIRHHRLKADLYYIGCHGTVATLEMLMDTRDGDGLSQKELTKAKNKTTCEWLERTQFMREILLYFKG